MLIQNIKTSQKQPSGVMWFEFEKKKKPYRAKRCVNLPTRVSDEYFALTCETHRKNLDKRRRRLICRREEKRNKKCVKLKEIRKNALSKQFPAINRQPYNFYYCSDLLCCHRTCPLYQQRTDCQNLFRFKLKSFSSHRNLT